MKLGRLLDSFSELLEPAWGQRPDESIPQQIEIVDFDSFFLERPSGGDPGHCRSSYDGTSHPFPVPKSSTRGAPRVGGPVHPPDNLMPLAWNV